MEYSLPQSSIMDTKRSGLNQSPNSSQFAPANPTSATTPRHHTWPSGAVNNNLLTSRSQNLATAKRPQSLGLLNIQLANVAANSTDDSNRSKVSKSEVKTGMPEQAPKEIGVEFGNLQDLQALTDFCKRNQIGIVPSHILGISKYCDEKRLVIGIRPVDLMATDLIAAGYPTKNINIKGKSANWGPQTGFICVDQGLSKLADTPGKIDAANEEVQSCLRLNHAQIVPLKITLDRLQKLCDEQVIQVIESDPTGNPKKLRAATPAGLIHDFSLRATDEPGSEYVVIKDGNTIDVLAPMGNKKIPLTADYDLLTIIPRIEEMGSTDSITPTSPLTEAQLKYSQITGNSSRAFSGAIDLTTNRTKETIKALNEILTGAGAKVFHHGSDDLNPKSDLDSNFPATFILPGDNDSTGKICITRDRDELFKLIQDVRNKGFYARLPPLWVDGIEPIRSKSFSDAKQGLEKSSAVSGQFAFLKQHSLE